MQQELSSVPTLMAVVRDHESSNGAGVIRFEPDCYYAVRQGMARGYALNAPKILWTISKANLCSPDTAQMIFATSWGDFQAMGFTLYGDWLVDMDPIPSIKEWLGDLGLQERAFSKWCASHGFDANGPLPTGPELDRFSRLYNGPGNVVMYSAYLRDSAAKLTLPKPLDPKTPTG